MQWVLVDDVARAAILAATGEAANGFAFNLAQPPITQMEFVRALGRAADRAPRLVHVPRERIEAAGGGIFAPPVYFGVYLDLAPLTVRSERARRVLDLEQTPFDAGLRETFAWYRDQDRALPDFGWEDSLLAGDA
jgi:nucleoside-diphosphate-sugar epimerase